MWTSRNAWHEPINHCNWAKCHSIKKRKEKNKFDTQVFLLFDYSHLKIPFISGQPNIEAKIINVAIENRKKCGMSLAKKAHLQQA